MTCRYSLNKAYLFYHDSSIKCNYIRLIIQAMEQSQYTRLHQDRNIKIEITKIKTIMKKNNKYGKEWIKN